MKTLCISLVVIALSVSVIMKMQRNDFRELKEEQHTEAVELQLFKASLDAREKALDDLHKSLSEMNKSWDEWNKTHDRAKE